MWVVAEDRDSPLDEFRTLEDLQSRNERYRLEQVGPQQRVIVVGLSYIAFGDTQNFAFSPGGFVRFRFEKPKNGKVPFTIHPGDVAIPPITVADGLILHYTLAGIANGSVEVSPGGEPSVTLTAAVKVVLEMDGTPPTTDFQVTFTTETTSATSVDGAKGVRFSGMRLVEKARYLQLVGAVTNRSDAVFAPGEAISTVLSGSFDKLPPLR